jgi:hypothetical protein
MFTVEALQDAVRQGRLRITHHAKEEMWEDRVTPEEVRFALLDGAPEIIEAYPSPQGRPYPMALLLARLPDGSPLHLVVAYDAGQQWVILVTVYRPDPERWDATFRHRKK